jgi:hypothetical protein
MTTGQRVADCTAPPSGIKFRLMLTLVGLALAASGCTSRAWYEGAQRSVAAECNRQGALSPPECVSGMNDKPFDSYEKERASKQQ